MTQLMKPWFTRFWFVNDDELKNDTNYSLIDVIIAHLKKKVKLQPVPLSMSLEALLTPDTSTYCASDGIDRGTGCNFIFSLCRPLVVGLVLKWLAWFITVPTTCSRPSIEMVAFIYVLISP